LDIKYRGNFPKSLQEVFCKRSDHGSDIFNESGVWRFRELLNFAGVDTEEPDQYSRILVSLDGAEGRSRPYQMSKVAEFVGMKPENVLFQPEGLNPSGSFKDNGICSGLTHAKMLRVREVVCASTGNTSASLAMYAANEMLRAIVYVPKGKVAPGKLQQAYQFGADVIETEGNFDDALKLVLAKGRKGSYVMNSVNPFRLEGQKTIVYRALDYLLWEPPDWFVVPRGNMGNVSIFGKALAELYEWGWIKKIPRIALVDAKGVNTFYTLYNGLYGGLELRWNNGRVDDSVIERYYSDLDKKMIEPKTDASAIQIERPVNIKKGLRSLEFTNGISTQVTDKEMYDGMAIVGKNGFDCELASGAVPAAIRNLIREGEIKNDDKVVGVLTGRLKDPEMIVRYHTDPNNRFANPPKSAAAT
jgi:threonine synthase